MNLDKLLALATTVESEDRKISADPVWQEFLRRNGSRVEPFARSVIALLEEIYEQAKANGHREAAERIGRD